ncbi:hypothetical protein [Nostoc sp. TCL26-01]|uniref:hypothetical protein n=1 Tax=Nostoc sp. TCL26-01 TaxID=2576904 RepID=UPI0015BC35F4|nr:hypothetical protein [Nostoc sp. TCL26-01]
MDISLSVHFSCAYLLIGTGADDYAGNYDFNKKMWILLGVLHFETYIAPFWIKAIA